MTDKNLLPDFDSIKDDDEIILWMKKPKFIPYAISGVGIGILLFTGLGFSFLFFGNQKILDGDFSNIFYLSFLLPVAIFVVTFLQKILSFKNTSYAFSNKRVMFKSGIIGIDFKTIDFDKISDMEVTVNFYQQIYNVGTIKFFTGRTEYNETVLNKIYDTWDSIPEPYEVFKKLKKVSVDIKTDFTYPNAFRPELNPGYKTKYKPDS